MVLSVVFLMYVVCVCVRVWICCHVSNKNMQKLLVVDMFPIAICGRVKNGNGNVGVFPGLISLVTRYEASSGNVDMFPIAICVFIGQKDTRSGYARGITPRQENPRDSVCPRKADNTLFCGGKNPPNP